MGNGSQAYHYAVIGEQTLTFAHMNINIERKSGKIDERVLTSQRLD